MRRGNGDGSIYKLSGKRRKPYAVRVTVGWTEEGKQQYKYVGYYSSKSDAKKALNAYLLEPEKSKLEKHTLKSVFESMIEKSKFTEGTEKQYVSGYKKFPQLHNRNIADIELWELEEVLKGETPATQARIKKTLHNCYKYAYKHDYVSKILTDFLEVDTIVTKEKQVFTLDQIETLWKKVDIGLTYEIPILLLYSGLRISELLNLKTSDVDIEAKTMFIASSKTQAGIRLIPIHEKIFPLIEKRFREQNTYLISNNGRRVPYSTFMREYWTQPRTPHEARHTFITYLTKCTDDTIAVKKLVGHATTDITEHYTHRTIDELKTALNALEYK